MQREGQLCGPEKCRRLSARPYPTASLGDAGVGME